MDLKYDSKDLPNLMAYFVGNPLTGDGSHDAEAERIGQRGKEFVEKYYRK